MADAVEAAILSLEGRGFINRKTVQVAQPGAGLDWSVTVDGGEIWIPVSIAAQLVTSAVVANRDPRLEISNSDGTIAYVATNAAEVASLTHRLCWVRGYGAVTNDTTGHVHTYPLPDVALMPGETVASVTTNIDAGDQWKNVRVTVLRIFTMSPEKRAEQEAYGIESGFTVPYRLSRSDASTGED